MNCAANDKISQADNQCHATCYGFIFPCEAAPTFLQLSLLGKLSGTFQQATEQPCLPLSTSHIMVTVEADPHKTAAISTWKPASLYIYNFVPLVNMA